MVRDALAHRLQPGEQPSPVLLVIEQAVDLPPVSRVRVLLLAQDVVERVGRGHDHGRDGRPPGQPSSAIPARESQTVVPDADLGGERQLSSGCGTSILSQCFGLNRFTRVPGAILEAAAMVSGSSSCVRSFHGMECS